MHSDIHVKYREFHITCRKITHPKFQLQNIKNFIFHIVLAPRFSHVKYKEFHTWWMSVPRFSFVKYREFNSSWKKVMTQIFLNSIFHGGKFVPRFSCVNIGNSIFHTGELHAYFPVNYTVPLFHTGKFCPHMYLWHRENSVLMY